MTWALGVCMGVRALMSLPVGQLGGTMERLVEPGSERTKGKGPSLSLVEPWNLLPKDTADDKGLQERMGRGNKYLD